MQLVPKAVPKLVAPPPIAKRVATAQPAASLEYLGVWKAGQSYRRLAAVTWGGSLWIALRDTTGAPRDRRDWRLAVKQGRDGRDGAPGEMPRHEWDGTRLRFEQPDGSWGKWVDLQGPAGRDGVGGGVAVIREAAEAGNSYWPTGW